MGGFANHSQTEYSPNNNQNITNKNMSIIEYYTTRAPLSDYLGSHRSKTARILQDDYWNIFDHYIALHFNPKNHLIISEL